MWDRDLVWRFGDRWRILSPSGGGKTTLFAYLAGLRRDYDGALLARFSAPWSPCGGMVADLRSLDEPAWARLRADKVAYVFQDLRLIDGLSAARNIRARRDARPAHSDQASAPTDDDVQALCVELEIDGLFARPVALLSRGERQRVAIVRALAAPFDLIVLDEAFSHLDARAAERAAAAIARVCLERGAGLIALDVAEADALPCTLTMRM